MRTAAVLADHLYRQAGRAAVAAGDPAGGAAVDWRAGARYGAWARAVLALPDHDRRLALLQRARAVTPAGVSLGDRAVAVIGRLARAEGDVSLDELLAALVPAVVRDWREVIDLEIEVALDGWRTDEVAAAEVLLRIAAFRSHVAAVEDPGARDVLRRRGWTDDEIALFTEAPSPRPPVPLRDRPELVQRLAGYQARHEAAVRRFALAAERSARALEHAAAVRRERAQLREAARPHLPA